MSGLIPVGTLCRIVAGNRVGELCTVVDHLHGPINLRRADGSIEHVAFAYHVEADQEWPPPPTGRWAFLPGQIVPLPPPARWSLPLFHIRECE